MSQQVFWYAVQRFLRRGDLILADQGTAFYGAAELALPPGARLIGQPLWASIGWALPAALGASLAAPDRRIVVLIGDGALQQTASELGTLLASGAAPVVIVLNNDGYAVERAIHDPSASYNYIPRWDWTSLPATVAPASATSAVRATSPQGLDLALSAANSSAGQPVLIEAVLGPRDVPPLLRGLARHLSLSNAASAYRRGA